MAVTSHHKLSLTEKLQLLARSVNWEYGTFGRISLDTGFLAKEIVEEIGGQAPGTIEVIDSIDIKETEL